MLQKLFIFLLLILILPDIYLYRMFIARAAIHPLVKCLYALPSLALLAGLVYLAFFAHDEFIGQHTHLVGWFAIVFFLFTLPKLVIALFSLLSLPFHYGLRWQTAPFIYVGVALATVLAGVILHGAFVGRSLFQVRNVTFASPRLPEAFDGYRIVQLSDLHIGSWKGNRKAIKRLADSVNALKPDLIVFTGDLVNNRADELDEFQDILSELKAPDGIYSVLGNHDYGPYYHWKSQREQAENLRDLQKRQADMGWKLLNNSHTLLTRGNDRIALVGVENEGEPPFSQHGDLPRALAGTEGMFQLLLSHNPTHWRREVLPRSEVDLMLAGHTHAMQMQLGHHSPASFIYPEWGGMYTERGRGLYVNVGAGYVGLPFRFGAWPEITLLTLQR